MASKGLTNGGHTLVATPSHGAGLDKGTHVVGRPPKGGMYRLPSTVPTPARAAKVGLAKSKPKAFIQRRWRVQALGHGGPHGLANPEICGGCAMAGATKQPLRRAGPNRYRGADFGGLVAPVDSTTVLSRDNDGNTCAPHGATEDLGYTIPCKTRNSGGTLDNPKAATQKLYCGWAGLNI